MRCISPFASSIKVRPTIGSRTCAVRPTRHSAATLRDGGTAMRTIAVDLRRSAGTAARLRSPTRLASPVIDAIVPVRSAVSPYRQNRASPPGTTSTYEL